MSGYLALIDEELTVHKKRVHLGIIDCKYCLGTFCSVPVLNRHIKRVHIQRMSFEEAKTTNQPPAQCDICLGIFHSDSHVRQHASQVHGKGTIPKHGHSSVCKECGKRFSKDSNLMKHIAVCVSAKPVKTEESSGPAVHCHLCQRVFKSSQNLRQHITKMHDEGREVRRDFDCDLCQVSLTSKYNLRQHTKAIHGMELKEEIKPLTY